MSEQKKIALKKEETTDKDLDALDRITRNIRWEVRKMNKARIEALREEKLRRKQIKE